MEAQAELGLIPKADADRIVSKATFNLERALELERRLIGRGLSLPAGGSLLLVACRASGGGR